MNTPRILTGLIGTFGIALTLAAGDSPALDPHLESLRPWLDKTWKGEFKDSKPDSPKVDIVRWERALNGKAVRILHSLNDGAYGGEALVETLKTGDKRLISYAVDLGTRITTLYDSKADTVREIHVRRGVLTARASRHSLSRRERTSGYFTRLPE